MKCRIKGFLIIFLAFILVFIFYKGNINNNTAYQLLGIPTLLFIVAEFYAHNWEINKKVKGTIFVIGASTALAIFAYIVIGLIPFSSLLGDKESSIEISETIPVQSAVPDDEFVSPEDLREEMIIPKKSQFIPIVSVEKTDTIFLDNQLYLTEASIESDRIELLREHVENNIQNKIGTECNADCDQLNGTEEYTSRIERTNQLQNSSIEDHINIIELREQAYSIGKTRELCLLLARDHYELGQLYDKNNVRQEAFNYYSKAIEYYNESFALMENNGEYKYNIKDIAYTQGQVYHSLGDIRHLDTEMRQKSYCMASAFYEISCGREKDDMYSYYYSGMINHKLALFEKENRFTYLLKAEKYYTRALEFQLKNITKKNLYLYLSQIYSELISFSNRYGSKGSMLPIETYNHKIELILKNKQELEIVQSGQIYLSNKL